MKMDNWNGNYRLVGIDGNRSVIISREFNSQLFEKGNKINVLLYMDEEEIDIPNNAKYLATRLAGHNLFNVCISTSNNPSYVEDADVILNYHSEGRDFSSLLLEYDKKDRILLEKEDINQIRNKEDYNSLVSKIMKRNF